jgi:ABC-type multidrug transport system fused ATPase/permease subunit
MFIKLIVTMLSLLPALFLPWPGKILVDNIIQHAPLDPTAHYPFFFRPLVAAIQGQSPAMTVIWVGSVVFVLLLLVGGWGTGNQDSVSGELNGGGTDVASRSENEANNAFSYVSGLMGLFDYRWMLRISQSINHRIRSRLFARIVDLPMAELDDQRIGDSVYRMMYDTPAITAVCYRLALTPIVSPLRAILSVWVMTLAFGYQPLVVWTGLGIIPMSLLFTLPFSSGMRKRMQDARDSGSATTNTIEEGMSNILAVQSLGGSAREKQRFEADSQNSFDQFRNYAVFGILVLVVAGLAASFLGLIVFYDLTDRIFANTMSVGDLWVIFAYYGQIATSATLIGRTWIYLQSNAVGLRRVFELMDRPGDHQPAQPIKIDTVREGFRFEDVRYSYADGTEAIKGVSFEARRGSVVALAGPAGAGKTTVASMIPRFMSPTSGRILLDGVDLQEIDRDCLRQQVAFVFQEPTLLDATVADNIRLGFPQAGDDDVRRALLAAGALSFVEQLPHGLETRLGRSGGKLSTGQRQRLSIARALVRNAPVLVLDEPTAALDPETELRLIGSLRELGRDRLVIIIAHRLSTIRHADQILFVEDGQIAERGRHSELLAIEGGRYRRFVELQQTPPPAEAVA